jgi:hypothetical protein
VPDPQEAGPAKFADKLEDTGIKLKPEKVAKKTKVTAEN